jgi:8-oxo-dGTP pyrophosphatase MutT (NUDIX family)
MINKTILAAGAVIYKIENDEILFALIHRAFYDDWSFPKGKIDNQESPQEAALREILEETNLEVEFEQELPQQKYVVKGETKIVYYWLAKLKRDLGFITNSEVDEICWLTKEKALNQLTYPLDRLMLSEVNK